MLKKARYYLDHLRPRQEIVENSIILPMDEETTDLPEKQFHGWRLLGIIFSVVVVLALLSLAVDWVVIGPLEGRVF